MRADEKVKIYIEVFKVLVKPIYSLDNFLSNFITATLLVCLF